MASSKGWATGVPALPGWTWVAVISLVALLVCIYIVGITVLLAAPQRSGAPPAPMDAIAITDLRVGDCIRDDPLAAQASDDAPIESADVVRCDIPHQFEVYVVTSVRNLPADADRAADAADALCRNRFEPYVGSDYEASPLELIALYPDATALDDGDTTVVCVLGAHEAVTSSLRGTGGLSA